MSADGGQENIQQSKLSLTSLGRITFDPRSSVTCAGQLALTDAVVLCDAAVAGRLLAVDFAGGDDNWGEVRPEKWDWISDVIGSAAFEQIMPGLREPISSDIDGQEFSPGIAWDDAWRLGLLLWLERWSWAQLDAGLLNLEVGLVAARLELPGIQRLAERRLLLAGPTLQKWANRAEAGRTSPALVAALTAAVSAAAGHLDPGLVRRIVDTRVSETEIVGHLQPTLTGRHRPEQWGAVAAHTSAEWVSSVDWAQVPRGVLDSEEETVTVKYDVEGRSLTVEVLAAAGAERYRWLRFRAVDPENPGTSAADGALSFDPSRGVYRGSANLRRVPSQEGAISLAVDVYSPYSPLPPRVRPWQLSLLASQRHAGRALVAVRLALAGPVELAPAVFHDAHRLWELASASLDELVGRSDADQVPQLDQLRAACLQQQRQCLLRLLGTPDRVLTRLDRRLADLPTAPTPNLDAPAGRPALAEVELTYRAGNDRD